MVSADELVVGIVALSDGKLVGRTRLQKTAYLLDQCGMRSGLSFYYHHYGPYCADLSYGCEVAVGKSRLRVLEAHGKYGVPYSIFRTTFEAPKKLGALPAVKAREILECMRAQSDIVMELAGTIVFLQKNGYPNNAEEEVKIRKPLKATAKRINAAKHLLETLGLPVKKKAPSVRQAS